jgi:hypothetical protein
VIQDDIKNKIKEAMLAKESVRLDVYRGISSAFTNELVAKGKKPTDMLADEESLAVVRRLAKQRKDSIDQFRKGNREDLAQKEELELKIIEEMLPAQMSRVEIEKVARAKKEEMGVTDKSKMGQFMGAVMKELKGRADGQVVKEVIESLF